MAKGLTAKQQLFIEAYLGKANGNATEAARLAGYKGNDVTLGAVGAENLKKPQIAEAVKARLEEAKKGMNADEVLKQLSEIAAAPWREFVEITGLGELKMRLSDKLKALELLGKYHKLFIDKVEHSGAIETAPPVLNVVIKK